MYMSDIEIAQSVEMKPITEIAAKAGVSDKYLDQYGKYKAKVDLSLLRESDRKDGKLILDFTRNIDGVAYATVDGRVMVMTYQGETHTFYEKIAFTVSFDSNGGTKVSSETVTNGKPLTSLTAPDKDGYVFEGWYTDEALTTPFNFGVTLITKDITLYAKWSEAAQP